MMFSRWRFDFRFPFFFCYLFGPIRSGVCLAQYKAPQKCLFTFVSMCFCSNSFRRYARNFYLEQERIESNVERQMSVHKCFSKRKPAKPNNSFFCSEWVLVCASYKDGGNGHPNNKSFSLSNWKLSWSARIQGEANIIIFYSFVPKCDSSWNRSTVVGRFWLGMLWWKWNYEKSIAEIQ